MAEHTHLDQARRDPGVCPACDVLWEAQRERTQRDGKAAKRERSLELLMNREMKLGKERYGRPKDG